MTMHKRITQMLKMKLGTTCRRRREQHNSTPYKEKKKPTQRNKQ